MTQNTPGRAVQSRHDRPVERRVVGRQAQDRIRVAAVEDPEAVAALRDVEVGPGPAVDDHHVPEELGVEDRGDVARRVGGVGAREAVEELPRSGEEERPVVVE
jgi:hypothetical protein